MEIKIAVVEFQSKIVIDIIEPGEGYDAIGLRVFSGNRDVTDCW